MDMPLNIAHRHQRKAEILVQAGKFDEAVLHHIAAEKALSEVVTATKSTHILQSLKLQQDFHIRQQAVVKRKKQLADVFKKYQDKMKEIRSKAINSILSTPEYNNNTNTAFLIQQMLKTALQHDSLINCITSSPLIFNQKNELFTQSVDSILKCNAKSPNDEKLKLEELRISNEELKQILFVLVTELEKARLENSTLKVLLGETMKSHKKPSSLHTVMHQPNITYHSLGPRTSLASVKDIDNVCDLPALAPVKMPDLELNKAQKSEEVDPETG